MVPFILKWCYGKERPDKLPQKPPVTPELTIKVPGFWGQLEPVVLSALATVWGLIPNERQRDWVEMAAGRANRPE
jgi:hypothetical protein